MQLFSNADTICAVATPPGAGGIGVVRISGPDAFSILERVWRGRIEPSAFEPRKLYLGRVAVASHESRATSLSGRQAIHDKVLAVKMPSPRTYTGQDVVELSCHGSQVVLGRVMDACRACGARLAGPGEFTRRAFMAGKMDLAQAEAVADLIGAAGERGASIAAEQLAGALSREIRAMTSELSLIRGEVEASIDFPDEGIEVEGGAFEDRLLGISERLSRLLSTYESGRIVRDGARVAIVGKPNSGKSSILNRLVGVERALVHDAPGTTRDVIEESISICGIRFRLRDTAGIREGGCEVETLGIERAREEIGAADVALVVLDGSRMLDGGDEAVLDATRGVRRIVAINKSDLPPALSSPPVSDAVVVSAHSGEGFDSLESALQSAVTSGTGCGREEGVVIVSARHKDAIGSARRAMEKARAAYASGEPAECVAQALRSAHEALGLITGESVTDEVLNGIFERFCIGK